MSGLTIVMCWLFRWHLQNLNKELDREEEEKGIAVKGFRYII